MSVSQSIITIKGTQDGLIFHVHDTCAYENVCTELAHKLSDELPFADGPPTKVTVSVGNRYVTAHEKEQLQQIIEADGHFIVQRWDSNVMSKRVVDELLRQSEIQVLYKTIRSGQVITCEGNLLILGDVNPGARIEANGHIFVLGTLRGTAHAGIGGNEQAVIVAANFEPMQIRIASVMSRSPEDRAPAMEFAYVQDGQIVVGEMNRMMDIRPHLMDIHSQWDRSE